MKTFTATATGVCTACFNRYTAGTKLIVDPSGKYRHAYCGAANRLAVKRESRLTFKARV